MSCNQRAVAPKRWPRIRRLRLPRENSTGSESGSQFEDVNVLLKRTCIEYRSVDLVVCGQTRHRPERTGSRDVRESGELPRLSRLCCPVRARIQTNLGPRRSE